MFWLHVISALLILAALLLLGVAWWMLYRAQRGGRLATRGPYALVRHPQYAAFLAILVAFLLQWPTLLTLLMFPVLLVMYARLARTEESEMQAAARATTPWPRRACTLAWTTYSPTC